MLIAACQQVRTQPALKTTPLPQEALVEVYFNHEHSSEYTEPYRKQRRSGDNLEQKIIDAIAQSKSSLDVAVQELRLPKIAQAIAERSKAGVKVRIILENTYSRPWSSFTAAEIAKLPERERSRYNEFLKLLDSNEDRKIDRDEINRGDALVVLKNAGIPLIDDTADGSSGSGLMHHKFIVVDGRTLIVTSANFTTSDIHGDFTLPSSLGNANNLVKIDSKELADLFTEEFNLMWGDGPGKNLDSQFGVKKQFRPVREIQVGNSAIAVQFSPTSTKEAWSESSNGLIAKTLKSATRSVDMALFVFSEQELANTLEENRDRGVQIRALIDPDFAYRSYSEALDMMGVAISDRCKYEVDNRPWKTPISTVGVPLLPKGDLLHHKFATVDGEIAITGSHNWSKAANTNNDETLLIIKNKTVASHFNQEFDRLYANAQLGINSVISSKIDRDKKQCAAIQAPKSNSANNSSVPSSKQNSASNLSNQLVNLNTATQAELEALPGIGPKLAQTIIQVRQQKPFTSLADLDAVPGVGPSLLEKLRDRVTW